MANLPRLKALHIAKAANETFAKPVVSAVAWKLKQFSPLQIGYNILSGSSIGRKALDYKFNLDYARDPTMGLGGRPPTGNESQTFTPNGGAGSIPSSGSDSSINSGDGSRVIVEAVSSGFQKVVDKLSSIQGNINTIGRTAQATLSETGQVKTKVEELTNYLKTVFDKDKFNQAQLRLTHNPLANEDETVHPEQKKNGIWNLLGGLAAGIGTEIIASLGKVKIAITKSFEAVESFFKDNKFVNKIVEPIKDIFGKIGKFIGDFKLDTLFKPFTKLFELMKPSDSIITAIGDFFKIFTKFGKFLDFIPLVGEVIAIVSVLYDGIKGFVSGFSNSKGSILDKIGSGLAQGTKDIVKGILDIPKIILQALKGIATGVLELLGFKDLGDKMKDFNLGKWWDDTIGKAIQNFDPNIILGKIGTAIVDFIKYILSHGPELLKDVASGGMEIAKSVAKKVGRAAAAAGGALIKGTEDVGKLLGQGLGAVSSIFESGKNGAGTISSGSGDAGGVSYGTFQLSSKTGDVLKFLDATGYTKQFGDAQPGTAEFNDKWRELAKNDPKFGQAQKDYIARTHYAPQMNKLASAGLDLSKRGRGVQEAVFSTAVQYGANTDEIKNALRGRDLSKLTDEDIIKLIQDYKASGVDSKFKSSSDKVKDSVRARIEHERKVLMDVNASAKREDASNKYSSKTKTTIDSLKKGMSDITTKHTTNISTMTNTNNVVTNAPSIAPMPSNNPAMPSRGNLDGIRP